jgi:hypothetical protein
VLWCAACSETVTCGLCDVALTFHKRIGRAVCHWCCEEIAPPRKCPSCTSPSVRYLGAGSERIENVIRALLPDARVARMDSDTMLRREDYEQTLESFGRGEIDVLVGTQMIAKGLDFPRVTVVGIVSADSSLHLPDFRAAERTFQLLSQVSGRAGRGELAGEIACRRPLLPRGRARRAPFGVRGAEASCARSSATRLRTALRPDRGSRRDEGRRDRAGLRGAPAGPTPGTPSSVGRAPITMLEDDTTPSDGEGRTVPGFVRRRRPCARSRRRRAVLASASTSTPRRCSDRLSPARGGGRQSPWRVRR